jgi:hypothetical protein
MRRISLFVVAAALILAGGGAWVSTTTQARVDEKAPIGAKPIDPFQIMLTARDLPTDEHDWELMYRSGLPPDEW